MATIDGLTKTRMLAIEAASVISGTVTGDDLILTKHDGTTVNAGDVRGVQGDTGPTGGIGPIGPAGNITVHLATTVNDTLSGLAARDGVTPVAGDLVLVKAQTTAANNGIYTAAAGAWSRWTSAANSLQVSSLGVVQVRDGTINGGERFVTLFKSSSTLGVTAMPWVLFGDDTAWQTLTVSNVSSGAMRWRCKNGWVIVDISTALIVTNAAGTATNVVTAANAIPSAYRPDLNYYSATFSGNQVGYIGVAPDGTVNIFASTGTMTTQVGHVIYPI